MLPLLAIVGAGAYGYHTLEIGKKDVLIAQLEKNNTTLAENALRLETALETEAASRERAEKNLKVQLQAVGQLTEKASALQAEMDDYLSIFKRHDLTKLARLKSSPKKSIKSPLNFNEVVVLDSNLSGADKWILLYSSSKRFSPRTKL